MLPYSEDANPLVGEESETSVEEEEASEGPGRLPTQIIESFLTHFGVLTNPHLLTASAYTLTGLEVGSRRERSSGNWPIGVHKDLGLAHGQQVEAPICSLQDHHEA